MRTIGWLLLVATGALVMLLCLGIVAILRIADGLPSEVLTNEIVTRIIAGLFIVTIVGVPGLLMVVFGKKKGVVRSVTDGNSPI